MDTTIVIGYQLFAKRLLESKVVFDLADGQVRTDMSLSRRAKTQRSTIDWHHTRKVLMHSYGEAHGFTPLKQEPFFYKAENDSCADGLEGAQVSDFGELENEDESPSNEDVPELARPLDEVEVFLKVYGRGPGADDVDPGTADPSTPQTKTQTRASGISVDKAIAAIMRDMSRGESIPKGGGVFDPAGADLDDVETGSGSAQDRRHALSFEKKGTQMLRLYFESLKLHTGGDILRWYTQNRDQMPSKCRRVYSVGPGWFPVDLMKAGKWPEMGRVTFDEAHTIRNLDSTFYIGARLVPAREILLVTGTPQFNGTHDILAYASLFAARSGLDQYLHVIPRGECSAVIHGVKSIAGSHRKTLG
jgi:hypothetical protein